MRHARARSANDVEIVVTQMIAVRQHRASSNQAELGQHFGIALSVALDHVTVFPVRFRTVRLHHRARPCGKVSEAQQQFVCARRNEPRGDDRLDEGTTQRSNRLDRTRRSRNTRSGVDVAVPLGGSLGMVHGHAADERPLAEVRTRLCQTQRRIFMD